MTAPNPVLALVAPGGTSARITPLLALVGAAGIEVVSWSATRSRGEPEPDALVVTDVSALDGGLPAVPTAVWVADVDAHRAALAADATVTLSARFEVVDAGAVFVPRVGLDLDRWPPLSPLVRQRWRERFGLPPELVVVAVEAGRDADEVATDLALASVAVIAGPDTALALALATPIVTSNETITRLGLRVGLEVEVADDPETGLVLARRIATSEPKAAALSRRGRRFAERQLDLGQAARTLVDRLGLASPLGDAAAANGFRPWAPALVQARLAEMVTPASSPLRHRAGAAFDLFSPVSTGALP